MTDNTSTEFKTEGQAAFPVENKENDNSSASSTGEKTNADSTGSSTQDKQKTDDKKSGEGEVPNDNPGWKKREEAWDKRFNEQEKRHVDELGKLREEFEGKITKATGPTDQNLPPVPAWFGGDEEAWKEYLGFVEKQNEGILTKAEERALNRITAKATEEQKAIETATAYFNESVEGIETDKTINPEGVKVDRNKLLKFTLDNDLVDSKGRWNYRAAFIMMKANVSSARADSTDEKKKIAAATTSENRAESKAPNVTSSNDFKGKNWGSL